jgi:hypothetical protein
MDLEEASTSYRTLKNSNDTRWNSSLVMIDSILNVLPAVNTTLKMSGHYDLCLDDEDKDILMQLKTYLESFRDLTELVSANQPHLGLIPLIKLQISTMSCIDKKKDHRLIQDVKQKVLDNVESRFEITETVKKAVICDPSLRKSLSMSSDDQAAFLLRSPAVPKQQII